MMPELARTEVPAADERLLVILDEWPYLAGSSRRLASVLQHVWDENLQQTRLMLVLSGSYLSVMERACCWSRPPSSSSAEVGSTLRAGPSSELLFVRLPMTATTRKPAGGPGGAETTL